MAGLVSSGMSFGQLAPTKLGVIGPQQQATIDANNAAQQTADSAKMRQLQIESQTLANQRDMQDASAAPGTTRFQGGSPNGSAGGSGTRTTASGGASGSNPALDALIAQVKNQNAPPITPATYSPSLVSGAPDEAANRATYGAAKERTGLALQSAMNGLDAELAQRGINGTGIAADRTSDLYGKGLGALADTDRQMAEADAAREYEAQGTNAAATNTAGAYNADANMRAQIANQQAQQSKMEMLARLVSLY